MEMVILKLSEISAGSSHGYTYRLHFGTKEGVCLVRYDNRRGKKDHKHIGNVIYPYEFVLIENLLTDFLQDVLEVSKQ